ncbi:hypothetical protein [Nonomuraea zeae]|uniref:TetR/AcrR family transcriptional regulator n=1 Tax=Nonomuraea zeae TaxID=1642303 RepID=A0A5S4FP03_9ACTN|nr:hypothetical protein [Nonomuraea zeae]TMR22406.1 hypothetical protein ETD85_49480 [Nonomuraea zeae]
MDQLIAWGRTQPPTAGTREEILRRYLTGAGRRLPAVMQFAQANHAGVSELAVGHRVLDRFNTLCELLAPPQAGPAEQLKARLAVMALHMAGAPPFLLPASVAEMTEDEKAAAALGVAFELVSGRHAGHGQAR